MLLSAGREQAIVLYSVSQVDPWLFCRSSSGLVFRRSLQDATSVW